MTRASLAALVAATLTLPAAGNAAELSWSAEFGIGVATSKNASTEATASTSIQLSYGGAFIGVATESLYNDPAGDFENSVSVGYVFNIGTDTDLTVWYGRSYFDVSAFDTQEVGLGLAFPLSETVSGSLEIVRDIDNKATDISAGLEYMINNKWTASMLVGNDGTVNYGEIGLDYAIRDNASAGFLIEFAEGSDPVISFGLTMMLGG